MENYDATVVVEYETDDEYRKCLLAAFKLETYDGLVARITKIVEEVPSLRAKAKSISLPASLDEEVRDLLLFSYEEFRITHVLLKKESCKSN